MQHQILIRVWRHFVLCVILFAGITTHSLYSQIFRLSDIDSSKFSVLRSSFTVLDSTGEKPFGLSAADFEITDGEVKIPTKNVTVWNCADSIPYRVVFLIDHSDFIKQNPQGLDAAYLDSMAVLNFLSNFPLTKDTNDLNVPEYSLRHSKVALVEFTDNARIMLDFSSDDSTILGTVPKFQFTDGKCNFNAAFDMAVQMLSKEPAYYQKFIVLLTYGKQNSASGAINPNKILSQLGIHNIQLYTAVLLNQQGGDIFKLVGLDDGYTYVCKNQAEIFENLFEIGDKVFRTKVCQLDYVLPFLICQGSGQRRDVSIRYTPFDITQYRSYTVPVTYKGFYKVISDESTYDLGTPALNQSSSVTVKITPIDTNFDINNIYIDPPGNFQVADWGDGTGNPPASWPIKVAKGTTRNLIIKYTNKDGLPYENATLFFDGLPCPYDVELYAGEKNVTVLNPRGGRYYPSCDNVPITWTGINDGDLVDLFYSDDNGTTWNVIDENLSGGKYIWTTPHAGNFKVKVSISQFPGVKWAVSGGGTQYDRGFATSADKAGNVYVAASYAGSADFGFVKLNSSGKIDGAILKYNSTGQIQWGKSIGTFLYDDYAKSVAADSFGNVYLMGNTYKGFSNDIKYSHMVDGKSNLFITKYGAANGNEINTEVLGSIDTDVEIQFFPEKMGIKNGFLQDYQIIITGKYVGSVFRNINGKDFKLPYSSVPATFTAIYAPDLTLTELFDYELPDATYSSEETFDRANIRYRTGGYTKDTTIGTFDLTNRGNSDLYLYRSDPVSVAKSAQSGSFTITKPQLTFTPASFFFGSGPVGVKIPKTITGYLKNTGKVPVTIQGISVDGVMRKDFYINGNYEDIVLDTGKTLDIKAVFLPQGYGERVANILVTPTCGDPVSLVVQGVGECGLNVVGSKYLGSSKINFTVKDTIPCCIQNLTNVPITISPKIEGDNPGDFDFEILGMGPGPYVDIVIPGDSCLDIVIIFTPTEFGARKAYISYYPPSNCDPGVTNVSGNGSNPTLGIDPYDWDKQRINGTYQGTISIYNNTPKAINVTSIGFVNGSQTAFTINAPGTPFPVPPNDKTNIPVTFSPTQEISYSEDFTATVEGVSTQLTGTLSGVGILPKMELSVTCGNPVLEGDTSDVTLTIKNTSASSTLKINSILIDDPAGEYFIAPGEQVNNLTITENSQRNISLKFAPKGAASGTPQVIVLADDYDGTFTENWKETRTNLSCPRLTSQYTTKLAFGKSLPCVENVQTISITNESDKVLTLNLGNAVFDGNVPAYSMKQNSNYLVQPGATGTVDVMFKPPFPGTFNSKVTIPNSFNLDIEVELSGQAVAITPSITMESNEIMVGEEKPILIHASSDNLATGNIKGLTVSIIFDKNTLDGVSGTFVDKIQQGLQNGEIWGWNTPVYDRGKVTVTGVGNLTTPFDKDLFEFKIMGIASNNLVSDLVAEIDYGCYKSDDQLAKIDKTPTCQESSKLIMVSGTEFGIVQPSPNPVTNIINIDFGVGFESETKIEIFNSLGNSVAIPVNSVLESGKYHISVPADQLGSGIYFIKFSSGYYNETQSFVVEH